MNNNSGVYVIRNIVNGKEYVGSSGAIKKRFSYHRIQLANQKHPNPKLQRSYNKHGAVNFEYKILCICSREDALDLEQKLIDTGTFEYNISRIARRPEPITRRVLQYSIEGFFIKEHSSLADAAREVSSTPQGVYHCCKGLSKSANNFRWEYFSENYNKDIGPIKPMSIAKRNPIRHHSLYEIKEYSKEGILLASHTDIVKLANEKGTSLNNMRRHIQRGLPKTVKGNIFKMKLPDE